MANTCGEKELKTDWDALTASDSTKYIGHEQTLRPTDKSLVNARDCVGID
jgi:hypothetical protein